MSTRDKTNTDCSISRKWSLRSYTLQTAVDVLGLPCTLKLARQRNEMGSVERLYETARRQTEEGRERLCSAMSFHLPRGVELTIQQEISLFYVRARILYLTDPDWTARTKGDELVSEHSQFVGAEVLIPLEYRGKVRLKKRSHGREYFNANQLVDDFPRFVRVEKDVACVCLGKTKAQVVRTGSILELDRVTKGPKGYKGQRENYLICKDTNSDRELAFPMALPIHFSRLDDTTRYTLNELIEQLALPQTVYFMDVNPFDVINADDMDARNMLAMLAGPVEILDLQTLSSYIGCFQKPDSDEVVCLLLPKTCRDMEVLQVHISSDIGRRQCMPDVTADIYSRPNVNCDLLRTSLYSLYCENIQGMLLKTNVSSDSYVSTETPDTPPLPSRYTHSQLKPTASVPTMVSDEGPETIRKRFMSTGDVSTFERKQGHKKKERTFSSYFSQFFNSFKIRRRTRSCSQFTISDPSERDLHCSNFAPKKSSIASSGERHGFTCYINETYVLSRNSEGKIACDATDEPDLGSEVKVEADVGLATPGVKTKLMRAFDIGTFYCEICRENALKQNRGLMLESAEVKNTEEDAALSSNGQGMNYMEERVICVPGVQANSDEI